MKINTNQKKSPNELANLARKIAFRDKVSTNSIFEPMLVQHGYVDEKGVTLKTHSITIGLTEDLDKVPSKETMEDFDLLWKRQE